jgi:serine/threonine protein kinase
MPLPESSDALAPATRLGEFEVVEVVGVGGFGIVYRAREPALEREVALKEYMPMGMVGRAADGRVTLRSRQHEEDFALGLRSFVNEARLLARFDHPALVKVHRFWEANGTAYMAMPFYKAQTLRQRRQEMGSLAPTQAWLLSMIEPLLGALSEMHRVDVFHRDIAPDNILWCADNRPVLLDFGAARHALTDRTQSLTAILKPQFAPIEQYADSKAMRQGPWTDVFALASTCYFMLTGRPPLPATARILSDELVPLSQLELPGFSEHVLAALDWAMAVRPQDRPQSVAVLWEALNGHLPVPPRVVEPLAAPPLASAASGRYDRTIQMTGHPVRGDAAAREEIPSGARRKTWLLAIPALAVVAVAAWFARSPDTPDPLAQQSAAASEPASASGVPAAASVTAAPVAAAPVVAAPVVASTPPARASAVASRAAGPRETCQASKPGNVDACVRRLCKTETRFRNSSTCARLSKQADPWWQLFKRS